MSSKFDLLKYKFILLFINLLRLCKSKNAKSITDHFFVLGSGRNGSTLLASILNAHKDVFIPPEQFILPYAIMKQYLSLFQTKDAWRKDIISMFLDDKKTLNWNVNLDHLHIDKKDISSLFDKIYVRYAKENKGSIRIWGDKTPINIHFIDFIYPEFTSAKYIFLIRDARDVVLSYKNLKDHKAVNTHYAIWKWKDSIDKLKYLQKRTDVLIVKYEKLVSNPDQEINRIVDYLGLSQSDSLIDLKTDASFMGVSEKSHHQNLNKPISDRSVGKWQKDLNKYDINLVNQECYAYLQEFGYII